MPVTIRPSPEKVGQNNDMTFESEEALFSRLVCAWESRANKPLLHSSFRGSLAPSSIVPYGNGFVNGVIRAFQQDLHLVLRPDDNSARDIVKHDGKEKLFVSSHLPFHQCDIAYMANLFMPLMQEHMADEDVQEWLLPTFSTTTVQDRAIGSMVMMATMKHYFTYIMLCGCGFPSVTLLGEVSDWEAIFTRLDKFTEYGAEPAAWSLLLKPVIKRFIATFHSPDSAELKDFWMRATHAEAEGGSGRYGLPTLDGWLTAFMYWNKEGTHTTEAKAGTHGREVYVLDGETFPMVVPSKHGISTGVVEVPVIVKSSDLGICFKTCIVAGSMGVTVTENNGEECGTVVQPCSGWWMLEYEREPLR